MALTDAKVKALKPQSKRYGVADGGGLKIEVMPNGTKAWRLFYRYGGKARMLTLGAYPEMRLVEAREAAVLTKREAKKGIDPNPDATEKAVAREEAAAGPRDDLFRDVAERWIRKREDEGASRITVEKYRTILKRPLLRFGETPVGQIDARDILAMLREIEALRRFETAKRTRGTMSQVFTFAIAEGNAGADPTFRMDRALVSARSKHHAGVTEPAQVGCLMRLIRGLRGRADDARRAPPLGLLLPPAVGDPFRRVGGDRLAERALANSEGADEGTRPARPRRPSLGPGDRRPSVHPPLVGRRQADPAGQARPDETDLGGDDEPGAREPRGREGRPRPTWLPHHRLDQPKRSPLEPRLGGDPVAPRPRRQGARGRTTRPSIWSPGG